MHERIKNRFPLGRCLALVTSIFLLNGCAAVLPFSGLLSEGHGSSAPPLQVHEETRVGLERGNFVLVKTNVWAQSRGFSLLGFVTICPATLSKAMGRMYAAAGMQPGRPQTLAHLVIEQTSSYYILFGIPKVEVRADIVEFGPEAHNPDAGTASGSAAVPGRAPSQ